jgi:hypothetical protein
MRRRNSLFDPDALSLRSIPIDHRFFQAVKSGIAPVQRGPPGPASTPIDLGRRICRLVGIWQCVTK